MGRFFRRGISKIMFATTIADVSAVTRLEIDGAQDLSGDVAEINGFQLSNSPIPTPNLQDQFTPQIDGEDTASDSSLIFYDRDDDETIRTALAKGTAGYILLFPYGDVPTERMEVWGVKSSGVNDEWNTGNNAARFQVDFAITEVPDQDVAIPAAA